MRRVHTSIILLISLIALMLSGCSTQDPESLVEVKTRSGVGIEIQPTPDANQSDGSPSTSVSDAESPNASNISTEMESGEKAQDAFDDYLTAKETGRLYERNIELTKLTEIETTGSFNDIKVEDGMIKIYHAFEIPNSCLNVTYDIVSEESTVYIVPEYVNVAMPEDFKENFSEQDCTPDVYEPIIFDIEHDSELEDIALFSYKRTNLSYLHIVLA